MRTLVLLSLLAVALPTLAADKEPRVYEMRTYYAAEGKLDALLARFRDHTCKLFEKHGMTNVGYWTPIENPEAKLVYVVAHKDRESAKKSWSAFIADPNWTKAYKASEANGTLVKKIEVLYMDATDYSPDVKAGEGERVFELRTYTASKGNLEALNSRFRDHTLKLFEKHGMTNLWYWVPAKGQKGEGDTLVYILAHKSVEAAKASFDSFRKDEAWLAARKASEEKAGGSLTAPNGVKSVFMKATDFSPIK